MGLRRAIGRRIHPGVNVSPSYRGGEGLTLGPSLPVHTLPPLCCWQRQLFPNRKRAAIAAITPSFGLCSRCFKKETTTTTKKTQKTKNKPKQASRWQNEISGELLLPQEAGAGSSAAKSSGSRGSPGSAAFTQRRGGREQQLPSVGDRSSRAVTSSSPCSQGWKSHLLPLHSSCQQPGPAPSFCLGPNPEHKVVARQSSQ